MARGHRPGGAAAGGSPAGLVTARALVVADGSGSPFAASLGLGPPRPRYASAVAVEVEAPVAEPDTARFEFGLVRHGFCWAFPARGLQHRRGHVHRPRSHRCRWGPGAAAAQPGPAGRCGRTLQLPLRVWDGHHALHAPGVVAVGDAASLCDPFLAEGLRPALLSGVRAAEALDRHLGGESGALAGYTAAMREQWGDSMAWGRRIAQVFYRVPKVGYQLGIKRPTAPQRIAQILSGEMGYGDIAQRVIKRLLFQRG